MMLLRSLATSLAACSLFGLTHGVPLMDKLRSLTPAARNVLKRATPTAPYFVVYSDAYVATEPTVAEINGFNVFAISFLLTSGAADEALAWQELTASERTTILDEYNAAGIYLVVSLFGSEDTPTTSGDDPITTANSMAAWALEYSLQGVDVDYEDFGAFDSGTGSAEQWLGNFTAQLRTQLPQGQYILTHARKSFSPDIWGGGGYLWVNEAVGSMIDWVSKGTTEYTTCEGLLYTSSSTWPESSIFQISANGVTLDKLVIGKPATATDANNGFMNTTLLASCAAEAYAGGWGECYPDAASSWITAVRGNTWPIPTLPSTTSTTSAATPTSTAPAGTGNCAGVTAWEDNVAYNGGAQVTYDGDLWTASYWNEASTPGGSADAWANDGACT
ncbi:glycoside hydrolase family 18 protein [Chiua virens]|nr:glycoside hydrolase family 18 protein [Chiua virens]